AGAGAGAGGGGVVSHTADYTAIGLDDLPGGGVGLTGPGSDAALRGVLAAAAVAADATVVIPRDLLHRLSAPHPPTSNVTVAADAHNAMHAVQLEIGWRFLASHDPTSHDSTVVAQHPPLVLLIEAPADPRRLSALAELGSDLRVRVIVAGPWPTGATWSVDPHGYISHKHTHMHTGQRTGKSTTIGRLNILDSAALAHIGQALRTDTSPTATLPAPRPPVQRPSTPFHLRILGPPRLTSPTDPDVHIRRSGSRQIAVYLTLHPDGVARADLLDNIVGHLKTSTAATSLNSCLHGLKQILTIDDRSALLRLDDGRYRLDPDLITTDWWQLLHHLQSGDLNHAVTLYTGPIADGYAWDWLPEHRQTARHLIADTHAHLAHLAHIAKTPDLALDHALAGISIDPYTPACYHAAIDAHLRLGNTRQAQILRHDLAQRLPSTHKHVTGPQPTPDASTPD
ncbi:MAG TPA: bacterial transcriptional activator domain-containing protein, partial [Candidatus Limnocylindrales bacterium]|nr:bacterial transcriptional activator domain-containing protein [Candidatus Limnocylindrales bacterium]